MTRVLVTGATGFIGRHLVPHLLDQNYELVLFLREAYGSGTPLPPSLASQRERFEVVYGDLRSFNLTVRGLKEAGPDVVVHLAAAGATEPFLNPETAVRYNVTGTINLVRAAFEKSHSTGRLIAARTPGERTYLNTYAASKRAAWDFCQMYARTQGWPITGAMIFQCYGPGQGDHLLVPAAVRAALAGQDFPMTAGTQIRDWIHLDDVVGGLAAMVAAPLVQPGETIELGSGSPTSVADVVRLIYELSGSSGRPLIGALPTRPGETAHQEAELAAARERLGWHPRISLREGLGRLIDQMRQARLDNAPEE